MTKEIGLPIFIAGLGIGVAATLFIRDHGMTKASWKRGQKSMSDIKDKVKSKIDDAADATKKAVDKVADKSKEVAHKAGEQLERGGKRLQDA
jgi:F0F1-type ATP synthase membrane subunit b/b'